MSVDCSGALVNHRKPNTKLTFSQDDWKKYHKIPCDLMIYIIVIYRGRRQLKHPTEIQIYPKPPKGECFFPSLVAFGPVKMGQHLHQV